MAKFSSADIWHQILHYQTLDLVKNAYKSKHGRFPSHKRIEEITSNFIQAKEYFINAEYASLSVRPLLLYYGVLGLSRGLILMLSPHLSEAALQPGHGISTLEWRETLSEGLPKIAELKIKFISGTFRELLEATKNKSYFRHHTSAVNWETNYDLPKINAEINFKELMASFPDLATEYEIWLQEESIFLPVNGWKNDPESSSDRNQLIFEIPKSGNISVEKIKKIFCSTSSTIEEQQANYLVKATSKGYAEVFFVQLFNGAFGIGDILISKTIAGRPQLATIPSLFCASYYLGMLCRYFPSIWTALDRQTNGDSIFPLINKLLLLIRDRYPETILEFLKSPYDFEINKT